MQARESGFSLIEILVVMGLLGIMSLFMMSVTKIGLSGQKNVIAMDDARNLTNEMATLLMNSTACLNTFGGKDPVASGGASATAVKNAANTAVYQINTVYGNKALRFAGVTLGGVGVQPKMNLQRYTASSATQGRALAEVNWAKTADTTGAAVLSRFFYVNVTLDGTNKITACAAEGGLAGGEIWKRSPVDSNKIYYNDGNVGVGTTAPVAKMDVSGEIKFGNTSSTCNSTNEGQQRYNSMTNFKIMQYCDGTSWKDLGWRTLPTSDVASYDTNCAYRVFTPAMLTATVVNSSMLIFEVSTAAFRLYALPAGEKTYLDVVEDGNVASTVTEDLQAVIRIQYRCD